MASVNDNPVVSAEKAPGKKLKRQIQVFRDDQFVRQMLDAIPSLLAVLNSHRQIIYANNSLMDMLDFDTEEALLGLRPGDVFECVHVFDSDSGCGTSEFCRSCGALSAILANEKRVEECRMTRLRDSLIQAHELEVTATPFVHAGDTFTIFSIVDKSAEHRRQMLERIFFHDIMNVVGSIKGFAELLELQEVVDKKKVCSSLDMLQRVARLHERHRAAVQRHVVVDEKSEHEYLMTDQNLLLRILGNMIINALEAIPAGETVTLGCRAEKGEVIFTVHNPGEIPARIKPEIFRRTYSTKGPGRGLGTYSMRLLSSFLQGEVSFASDAHGGTVFTFRVPQNLDG